MSQWAHTFAPISLPCVVLATWYFSVLPLPLLGRGIVKTRSRGICLHSHTAWPAIRPMCNFQFGFVQPSVYMEAIYGPALETLGSMSFLVKHTVLFTLNLAIYSQDTLNLVPYKL